MAPVLAALLTSLAKSGLTLIGEAVLTKGKEAVEEKLGVNLDNLVTTEEGRKQLLQLQFQHEDALRTFAIQQREQDLREQETVLKDVADSRNANARIQESENASWLAKNTGYVIDFIIIGATLLMSAMLMFKAIPAENREQAFAVWGALMALCGTVVQWHRGSSSGSQRKTAELAQLARERT